MAEQPGPCDVHTVKASTLNGVEVEVTGHESFRVRTGRGFRCRGIHEEQRHLVAERIGGRFTLEGYGSASYFSL